MSGIHLPSTFRVKKGYWNVALILIPISFLPVLPLLLRPAKEPVPMGLVWSVVFFVIFWGLLIWWSGWIFRLDLTNEGFHFRAHFGNWKMDWHRIQKVEHKIYRSRGGPRVQYFVFGNDPEKPAKLRFMMFEKGTVNTFFKTLKAKAPKAKLDEEVLALLR